MGTVRGSLLDCTRLANATEADLSALSLRTRMMPVWLVADSSKYSSWQFLVVGVWLLAGVILFALAIFIISTYGKSHA